MLRFAQSSHLPWLKSGIRNVSSQYSKYKEMNDFSLFVFLEVSVLPKTLSTVFYVPSRLL